MMIPMYVDECCHTITFQSGFFFLVNTRAEGLKRDTASVQTVQKLLNSNCAHMQKVGLTFHYCFRLWLNGFSF